MMIASLASVIQLSLTSRHGTDEARMNKDITVVILYLSMFQMQQMSVLRIPMFTASKVILRKANNNNSKEKNKKNL